VTDERTGQLDAGLRLVRDRIARACDRAGRDADGLTLIVVTKTYPAADVLRLVSLGVGDFGENRHPEGADKARECAEAGKQDLSWHFVGALQTNKATAVARYASWVHSVDRVKLVHALDRGAEGAGRQLDCLVQVSLDPPSATGRSGAAPPEVAEVAREIATASALRLRGVMAVAPLDQDPVPAFAVLAEIAAEVASTHPGADVISAGMTGDLEQAIAAGATHLRVGRAVLGERALNG